MTTTDQILELVDASKFLISLATTVKNHQIAVMCNITSSTCNSILSSLYDEALKDELHYLLSNLINDLLVISEDMNNCNIEKMKALAVLFKLTSNEFRTHFLVNVDLVVQKISIQEK